MKHLLHSVFCGVLLLAGIFFGSGVASAHTMTDDEAVLLTPKPVGNRVVWLEFRCGMPLQEVQNLLGSDFKLQDDRYEFRMVRYNYHYNKLVFGATTLPSDTRPAGELPIGCFECATPGFKTRSGLRLGDLYAAVEAMFGAGEVSRYDSTLHYYTLPSGRVMSFKVDEEGRIAKIAVHTPI